MINQLFSFMFQIIGAFSVWTFKGFKGKFNDEMTGPYDSSNKRIRNFIISGLFLFLVFIIISSVAKDRKKEPESIYFEYKFNK